MFNLKSCEFLVCCQYCILLKKLTEHTLYFFKIRHKYVGTVSIHSNTLFI